jgi:hypothetical protein
LPLLEAICSIDASFGFFLEVWLMMASTVSV